MTSNKQEKRLCVICKCIYILSVYMYSIMCVYMHHICIYNVYVYIFVVNFPPLRFFMMFWGLYVLFQM